MWERFPLQTYTNKGDDCQLIDRDYAYKQDGSVVVSPWKDVPSSHQTWCLHVWGSLFSHKIDDTDLVGIIPQKGVILAKYGRWIGKTRSRAVVYINNLYVSIAYRGQGIAEQLIESITYSATNSWGQNPFLFELENVPTSLILRNAEPLTKFSYVWIVFFKTGSSLWKPFPFEDYLSDKPGFISSYAGWKGYKYNDDIIIFDSLNDIVWYSSMLGLYTFDALPIDGAFCRIFSQFGNISVYAENMYFDSGCSHFVLA
jgi:hypothetical protein